MVYSINVAIQINITDRVKCNQLSLLVVFLISYLLVEKVNSCHFIKPLLF